MADFENTVAAVPEGIAAGTPADDAQAAGAISVEDMMASMLGEGNDHETAEETGAQAQAEMGDGGPDEPTVQQGKNDKFGKRISAALASQKEQIFKSLGMSEADVRELIRAHKAEQMHKEDPEISPKAARRILEEQEKAQNPDAARTQQRLDAAKREVAELSEAGWTREELTELTREHELMAAVSAGEMTLKQAARAFLKRGSEQPTRKKAIPTARNTAAGDAKDQDPIASMSREQFAALRKRVREASLSGTKVHF